MRAHLIRSYYWPHMKDSIRKFCGECLTCQRERARPLKHVGLSLFWHSKRPWRRICIDWLGGVLPECDGTHNKYLLTIVDTFTQFPIAIPMSTKDPEAVADVLLNQVFYAYDFPRWVHSNNAPEFVSEVMRVICERLGVHKGSISVGNPQSNAPVERFHAFLNTAFTLNLRDYTRWDETIPLLLFAFRVTPNEATDHSPFFLLYGNCL